MIWLVDDLKSHMWKKDVIEDMIKSLGKKFGKEKPSGDGSIRVPRPDLDYWTKVKVKLSMFEYVKKLINELPNNMVGTAKMPAANHLFMTNDKCEKLLANTAQLLHIIVARHTNSSGHSMYKGKRP